MKYKKELALSIACFLLSFLCPAGNSPAAAPLFCYPLTIRFLLSSLEVFSDRRQIFCRFLFWS